MKSIKLNGLRTISGLLLLLTFTICSSSVLPDNKTDFTGTWIINLSKSDFGDSPLYVAPKHLKVKQYTDKIEIERVVIGVSGADSTMHEQIAFGGGEMEMITADKRTRHYTINWVEDGKKMLEEYSSSYSNNPGEEEYHTTEMWQLSADGKQLTLKKKVVVSNGYEYEVTAVYEKQ